MRLQRIATPEPDDSNARAEPSILIAPSVLSAGFKRLSDEIRAVDAAGAEWIDVDGMDGGFISNVTVGAVVPEAVRWSTAKLLNVHLVIVEPERRGWSHRDRRRLDSFWDAGLLGRHCGHPRERRRSGGGPVMNAIAKKANVTASPPDVPVGYADQTP
jgi:hypothetical protein